MAIVFLVERHHVHVSNLGFNVETPEYLNSDIHASYFSALRHVVRIMQLWNDSGVIIKRWWHPSQSRADRIGRLLNVVGYDVGNDRIVLISVTGRFVN